MLKTLLVQNYALIDTLEIDFHQGLNIITGETGAGKSIILGALGLILGNRAEATVLKEKSKPCVVEGTFNLAGYSLQDFFVDNDIEYADLTTIRRHINPAGKSRAFVNELPVTLSILKDLVSQIIDIHSQHQNLLLADGKFQLSVLDSFTDNLQQLASYRDSYQKYRSLTSELENIKEKASQAKADLDYLQFQLKQLNEAKLKSGEEIELESLQQQLSHAEEIKSNLQSAFTLLNADESSILIWLKEAVSSLSKISHFFNPAEELQARIESCRVELKDIAHEVEMQNERVLLDPAELEAVTQRLDMILSLQQKHRVSSVDELIEIREKLDVQVNEITNYDQVVSQKEAELEKITKLALKQAQEISDTRKAGSKKFEDSIKALLTQLGMPYADFKVNFEPLGELRPQGIDRVTFLFSANKQMPLNDLSKIASGGELSRLMLSLKSLMVKTKGLPTIILDEIDTGVSGEVADKVGNIISSMAKSMQVINITHLPQIACKGSHHFLVYKDQEKETTETRIRLLTSQERITEIAKMLSGEKISEAAITNAKHLLGSELN
ncbi:DNA repair protein RecN [Perlabentimonas gracilis]|uniref:DNA repair protein RecN n=1 Tax=Perlabentimonas gracilis TaxID=2715279 RepID=UPI0014080509|nr:DNA repair protein RecN [Perlabentimonas gracilis]NHB69146.1 DNA repair protein RecN [Perlabentimonas gracilis]